MHCYVLTVHENKSNGKQTILSNDDLIQIVNKEEMSCVGLNIQYEEHKIEAQWYMQMRLEIG